MKLWKRIKKTKCSLPNSLTAAQGQTSWEPTPAQSHETVPTASPELLSPQSLFGESFVHPLGPSRLSTPTSTQEQSLPQSPRTPAIHPRTTSKVRDNTTDLSSLKDAIVGERSSALISISSPVDDSAGSVSETRANIGSKADGLSQCS